MRKYILLFFVLGAHHFSFGQQPPFDWSDVPVLEMTSVDNAELKARYAPREKNAKRQPLQFAHAFQTDIGRDQFKNYKDRKGRNWYALVIKSSGAFSLNIAFDQLLLPEDAELYLYSLNQKLWKGPLKKEKREVAEYWSPIVSGDAVAVVIVLPDEKKSSAEWHIQNVNHDFLGFQSISSGSCNVDVICGGAEGFPEIDQYRDIIRSVGVYSVNGRFTCSGALINTSDFGCEPYFLTANHCIDENTDYSSVVVYWNYENSTCRTPGSPESGADGDGSLDQFNSGANLRSTNERSDFTLVELAGEIAPEVNAYLAGWNRQRRAPDRVIAIHHPATEEKRISFEYDPLILSEYLDGDEDATADYLRVEDWDLGTTEGGSSGSPIFNASGQIVGQLSGGFAACGNDDPDWYGAMYSNFERGQLPNDNIGSWLDDSNRGASFASGIDYNSCADLQLHFEPLVSEACSDGDSIVYRFKNNSNSDSVFLDYDLLGVAATAVWNGSPDLGPQDEVQLIITDLADYGNGRHVFDVLIAKDMNTQILSLELKKNESPDTPKGISPVSGEDIFPNSLFRWDPQPGVEEFIFTYAYSSDFVDSTRIQIEANETMLNGLQSGEDLFLRIYAENGCGISTPLEASYSVENISCERFELNVQVPITDLNTIEVPVPVGIEAPLASTTVRKIRGTHSWTSDLIVNLYFDPARQIELLDSDCPFNIDFDLGFSDLGLEELDCPLTSGDLYRPATPFSAWNGSTGVDTFWLSIEDTQSADEGMLEFIDLEVCTRETEGGFITDDFELTMFAVDTMPIKLRINPEYFADSNQVELSVDSTSAFDFIDLPSIFIGDSASFSLVTNNTPEGIYQIEFTASDGSESDTLKLVVEVLPCTDHPTLMSTPDTVYRYYYTFSWENTGAPSYEFILSDGPNPANSNILDSKIVQDTFYRSPFLRDTLQLYWTVRPGINTCSAGKPQLDSFYTSVDYMVDIGTDSLRLCGMDTSQLRLQIGDRVIDRFFFSIIQDTLTNNIRFRFDPDALQDTNVMYIDILTGNTSPGFYDFLLVVDDNQNFSDPVQLTIEIIEPSAPAQLITPALEAQNVGRFPDFEWVNAADSAIWQLSLDPNFADILYSRNVGNLTRFSFADQLTPMTEFFWRVLFYSVCGEITSEVWSFTTDNWVNNVELSDSPLSVHPNPMHEFLYIEMDGILNSEKGDVLILDELGRLVFKNELQTVLKVGRINTSNLVSGTYVLKIATKDSIFTSKVIKH